MSNQSFVEKTAQEAVILSKRYEEDALVSLFAAELKRISGSRPLAMGVSSAGELTKEFLAGLGDSLVDHREYTSTVATILVPKAMDFLAAKGWIDLQDLALSEFVVTVFVAIAVGVLMRQWELHRGASARPNTPNTP